MRFDPTPFSYDPGISIGITTESERLKQIYAELNAMRDSMCSEHKSIDDTLHKTYINQISRRYEMPSGPNYKTPFEHMIDNIGLSQENADLKRKLKSQRVELQAEIDRLTNAEWRPECPAFDCFGRPLVPGLLVPEQSNKDLKIIRLNKQLDEMTEDRDKEMNKCQDLRKQLDEICKQKKSLFSGIYRAQQRIDELVRDRDLANKNLASESRKSKDLSKYIESLELEREGSHVRYLNNHIEKLNRKIENIKAFVK